MTLIDFIKDYPDEFSCKTKFKQYREHVGVVCPKCGSYDHYWRRDKECYECKHCKHRQGLRANTVMHKTKLPYRYWFITMHLLTSTKKSFSAKELQRQLGHKRYHPVWHMSHKLREAMGKPEFLQKYLDEFCYKFNHLLVACMNYKNEFRYIRIIIKKRY